MSPIILGLAPFVIFPAIVFLFLPARVRRIAFVLATLVALLGSWLVQGLDNPMHLLTIVAFGIAGGALLIEFAAMLRTLVKGRRAAHG
jgi:peptidoglycan/LPS O-acetylase OafA/YrhL